MTWRVVLAKGAAGASGLLSRRASKPVEALRERGLETSADPFLGRIGARHGSIWRGLMVVNSRHQRPLVNFARCSSCLLELFHAVLKSN